MEFTYAYNEQEKTQIVTILQKQKNHIFRLPMAVDIYHADGHIERHQIEVSTTEQTFTFPAEQAPLLVNLDADKVLLGEKLDDKPTAMFVYQLENAPLFLDKYDAILKIGRLQKDNEAVHQAILNAMDSPYWMIRKLSLERVEMSMEDSKLTIVENLKKLATKDPKSLVRSAALERLSELHDKSHTPVFQQAVSDSSYLVVATSLRQLNDLAPSHALEFALKLEEDTNPKIVSIVSKIYAEKGKIDKQIYFEERLLNSSGNNRYTLVEFYGDFLSRIGDNAVDKGLPTLEQIAVSDKNWWIRLNATQSIASILEVYREKKKMLSLIPTSENTNKNPNIQSIGEQVQNLNQRIEQMDSLISDIKAKETHEKVTVLLSKYVSKESALRMIAYSIQLSRCNHFEGRYCDFKALIITQSLHGIVSIHPSHFGSQMTARHILMPLVRL